MAGSAREYRQRRRAGPRRRSTSWSTAPTSSCTSRSSSSAAATRPGEINLEGLAQRVRGGGRRRVRKRLVYTSSVAAYGFHDDNPDVLTEDIPPRGTRDFYYSAQKAELEALLDEVADGVGHRRLRVPPLHRRRARRADARSRASPARRSSDLRLRPLWRALDSATADRARASRRRDSVPARAPDDVGDCDPRGCRGTRARRAPTTWPHEAPITVGDIATALGWRSVRVPRPRARRARPAGVAGAVRPCPGALDQRDPQARVDGQRQRRGGSCAGGPRTMLARP